MSNIGIIFDLDLTLIDSSAADKYRSLGQWQNAYATISKFQCYEGIAKTLVYLKDKLIPYCIVTSAPSTYCVKVCDYWNIDHSNKICYHDYGYSFKKPNPKPILMGVEKMGLEPKQVLSFGDRDIDIIASNKAGVASVACLWGAEDKEKLLAAHPNYIISSPAEIIPLVEDFFK